MSEQKFKVRPIRIVDGLFLPNAVHRTPDLADSFPGPASGYATVYSALKRTYRNSKATKQSIHANGQNPGSVEAYVGVRGEEIMGMGSLSDLGEVAVIGFEETPDSPDFVNGHNVSDWIIGNARGHGYGTALVNFLVDRATVVDIAVGRLTWTLVKPGEYGEELAIRKGAKLAGVPGDYSHIDDVKGDRQIVYLPLDPSFTNHS